MSENIGRACRSKEEVTSSGEKETERERECCKRDRVRQGTH